MMLCRAEKETFEGCGADSGEENEGKRRRSSRVIARELKNTEGCRCELRDSAENNAPSRLARHSDSVKPRDCLKPTSVVDCANAKKDWSNVVLSDEHTFKQFKGGNPRHNFVWAKSVRGFWEGDGAVGADGGCVGRIQLPRKN